MKIYTEINYKWLDGQLVKTDDKSFEYEGEISFCAGAAGAAGDIVAAAGDMDKKFKEKVSETLGDASDATGATAIAETVVEPLAEAASDVGDAATGVATDVVEVLEPPTITPPTITPPTITPPTITPPTLPDLPSQIEKTLTDPLGAATTGLGNLGENVGALGTKLGETTGDLTKLGGLTEAVATGTQNALQNLQITNLGSTVNDAMNVIGTNVGLGGNTLDALVSTGETLDDIMDPINEVGWAITDAGVDAFNWLNDTVAGLGQDLTQQIHGTQDPKTKVELEKMKGRKGKLKNKSRGQLRLNKSKGRARKSLRIG